MTDCMIRGNLHGSPHQPVWEICKMNNNQMASANSRTFAQAIAMSTSSNTRFFESGIVVDKRVEGAHHRFHCVTPWTIPVVDVGAWLQRHQTRSGIDLATLSVGQMRKHMVSLVRVGIDGIRRILFSEPQPDGVKCIGMRMGRVVEVVYSFA